MAFPSPIVNTETTQAKMLKIGHQILTTTPTIPSGLKIYPTQYQYKLLPN